MNCFDLFCYAVFNSHVDAKSHELYTQFKNVRTELTSIRKARVLAQVFEPELNEFFDERLQAAKREEKHLFCKLAKRGNKLVKKFRS